MIKKTKKDLNFTMKTIVESIDEIKKEYFKQRKTKLLADNSLFKMSGYRSNESSFQTQLVRNTQNKLEDHKVYGDDIIYDTDPAKNLALNSGNYSDKYMKSIEHVLMMDTEDSEEIYKKPDFVIHAGSEDHNPENQIFISEIKSTFNLTQNLFDVDLLKTSIFKDELHFKNSAFIIFNSKVALIKEMFSNYLNNNFYVSKNNGVYILIKPSYQEETTILEL